MRKIAVALGAIAFTLGAANVAALAQSKPVQPATATTEAAPPPAKKKVVAKRTPAKVTTARYQSKCKPGQRWDATASIGAGACIKRTAKVKLKSAPKAADAPLVPAAVPAAPKKAS